MTVFGMAAFPLGVALAAVEIQQPALARAIPIAAGGVVLIAGALQFTGATRSGPWGHEGEVRDENVLLQRMLGNRTSGARHGRNRGAAISSRLV